MLVLSHAEIKKLKKQIKKTKGILEEKYQSSGEFVVQDYIQYYQKAINLIDAGDNSEQIKNGLMKLLNLTRGYLETSSDYNQKFLNEMAETEKIIKTIL